MTIVRITAFKVINEADIQSLLDAYKVVEKENQKVCHSTQLA